MYNLVNTIYKGEINDEKALFITISFIRHSLYAW